jgi:polysaccharide pyruvyl transferase WcaK-like protein
VRRILISGYYGWRNTGDDALLAASAWGVRRSFGPAVEIAATAPEIPTFPGSAAIRPTIPRVQRFRGEVRLKRAWAALHAGSFVFGGGSVFHTAAQLEFLTRLLRLSGKGPHVAAGVSLGPFRSVADERACARLLRRLRFVGLRDRASAEIAGALAPDVETRLTFDVAALVSLLEGAPTTHGTRRGIGLALCENERDRDEARDRRRRDRITAMLSRLAREVEEEVVFIDFNGDTERGDRGMHADLAARAAELGMRVRSIRYDSRPLEVLRRIGSLRAIVAMRLHAAVFGYLTGTATLLLSYHPKCIGWSEQVGLPPACVHDSTDFDVAAVAEELRLATSGRAHAPALPVAEAQRRALLNFPDVRE